MERNCGPSRDRLEGGPPQTGDPDVIGWSALVKPTLAGHFLPLLSERGKCVAVPASASGVVEASNEVNHKRKIIGTDNFLTQQIIAAHTS